MMRLIVSGSILYIVTAVSAVGGCLSYEPTEVTLEGMVQIETHPGRPNYESIENGDEPETGPYLHLMRPACTKGEDKYPEDVSLQNITRVQLLLSVRGDEDQYKALVKLAGRKISVTGTLFGAFTGHHHAPLLMNVRVFSP